VANWGILSPSASSASSGSSLACETMAAVPLDKWLRPLTHRRLKDILPPIRSTRHGTQTPELHTTSPTTSTNSP
jgi:hypothetical protein